MRAFTNTIDYEKIGQRPPTLDARQASTLYHLIHNLKLRKNNKADEDEDYQKIIIALSQILLPFYELDVLELLNNLEGNVFKRITENKNQMPSALAGGKAAYGALITYMGKLCDRIRDACPHANTNLYTLMIGRRDQLCSLMVEVFQHICIRHHKNFVMASIATGHLATTSTLIEEGIDHHDCIDEAFSVACQADTRGIAVPPLFYPDCNLIETFNTLSHGACIYSHFGDLLVLNVEGDEKTYTYSKSKDVLTGSPKRVKVASCVTANAFLSNHAVDEAANVDIEMETSPLKKDNLDPKFLKKSCPTPSSGKKSFPNASAITLQKLILEYSNPCYK